MPSTDREQGYACASLLSEYWPCPHHAHLGHSYRRSVTTWDAISTPVSWRKCPLSLTCICTDFLASSVISASSHSHLQLLTIGDGHGLSIGILPIESGNLIRRLNLAIFDAKNPLRLRVALSQMLHTQDKQIRWEQLSLKDHTPCNLGKNGEDGREISSLHRLARRPVEGSRFVLHIQRAERPVDGALDHPLFRWNGQQVFW